MNLFNKVTSIIGIIFALFATIAFWYFIYNGTYDNWYPLLGHGISAHGALIGLIFWQYLEDRRRTASEQFNIWFKKKK